MAKEILTLNSSPLTYNYLPLVYEVPLQSFLKFYTNASTNAFDPLFTTSAGLLNWNLGDGSTLNGYNNFSHIYSQSGNKYVQIYDGTTTGADSITTIDMESDNLVGVLNLSSLSKLSNFSAPFNTSLTSITLPDATTALASYFNINGCNITGSLDFSKYTSLGGQIILANNPLLIGVTFPKSSGVFNNLDISGTNIPILDISSLTNFGGNLWAVSDPSLTKIINNTSTQSITNYWVNGTNLTGGLDCSGLTGLRGAFRVETNANLTQIINPVSSGTFTNYQAYSCNLTGTLDLRTLTGLGGVFLTYSNPGLNTILNPSSNITFSQYRAYLCGLTGTLDCSGLILGGIFDVRSNPSLNTILHRSSSQTFSNYLAYNCGLTGTLDVSCFPNLGGAFRVENNSSLNKIIHTASPQTFSSYRVANCNLTGTLDISSLTGFGGQVLMEDNPNLTQIIHPTTATNFVSYYVYDCSLNGTLDISGLTNIGGDFEIQNNRNLTALTLPTTIARQFTIFNTRNCSLNLSSVDEALLKLRNLYDASAPIANIIINLDGSGNSWPTDGSSNTNILGLYSAFSLAGKNASININYPPLPPPVMILQFTTNASTQSFDPVIDTTGLLDWDLGGVAKNASNNFSYTFPSAGNKTVIMYKGTTNGSTGIIGINMNADNLVGTLDLSTFTSMTNYALETNPLLNRVIFPKSTAAVGNIALYNCGLMGTLDISGLTNLGGQINLQSNPSLNYILNPTSSQNISLYWAASCDISGTLNMRPLSNLGGSFIIYGNHKLTQVLLPANNRTFSNFWLNDNSLNGVLDVSGLTSLGGNFDVNGNTNLTNIIFPTTSQTFTGLHLFNCNLTGTLDASKLSGVGGAFRVENNRNLTRVINPTSSQIVNGYYANDCSLNGTLDISGLTNISSTIRLGNNTNLTNLILPASLNQPFVEITARNCSLNLTSVDNIFSKLRTLWNVTLPVNNATIYVDGSAGNSWPTDGSSNADIIKIYQIFDGSTVYDVSILHNYPPSVPPEVPLLVFTTNASTNAFDPTFTVT